MPTTMERGNVSLPADVINALRERLRQSEGPEIADAPIAMVFRYVAALHAGLSRTEAARYVRNLPRGRSFTRENNPNPPKT